MTLLRRLAARLIPESLHPTHCVLSRAGALPRGEILFGPFKGLKYVDEAFCSALFPKLLGTYECELSEVIDAIVSESPARLIDIGAAEGYYACGFALRLPGCRIHAFEADLRARYFLSETVALNGLSGRVAVKGLCTPASLVDTMAEGRGSCVVICDAEGAEFELLDPVACSALRDASILVEMHDFAYPNLSDRIIPRFQPTHTIVSITAQRRTKESFPCFDRMGALRLLPSRTFTRLLDEQRPEGMTWLWMTPHIKAGR